MIKKKSKTFRLFELHFSFLSSLTIILGLLLLFSGISMADEIEWAKSAKKGFAAAKNSDRLVMIDFYTDW